MITLSELNCPKNCKFRASNYLNLPLNDGECDVCYHETEIHGICPYGMKKELIKLVIEKNKKMMERKKLMEK